MKKIALLIASVALPLFGSTIDYRFDEVKRKVTVTTAKEELRVDRGAHAQSGDRVQTGWLSYALIASEHHRAKFELFGSTDVRLAGNEPGVILSVERGKLRAMFDKITGTEPRVVKTPGALLAVRGTAYTVSVDDDGRTNLQVFEGTVEVRSTMRAEPMLIHAGEAASYSRREPPVARPMPQRERERGMRPEGDNGKHDDGHGEPGQHGQPGQPQQPSRGGDAPRPPAQPMQPPQQPPGHGQAPPPPNRPPTQ
jgi:hypothetical protein